MLTFWGSCFLLVVVVRIDKKSKYLEPAGPGRLFLYNLLTLGTGARWRRFWSHLSFAPFTQDILLGNERVHIFVRRKELSNFEHLVSQRRMTNQK
jgi:hypothetical protein